MIYIQMKDHYETIYFDSEEEFELIANALEFLLPSIDPLTKKDGKNLKSGDDYEWT